MVRSISKVMPGLVLCAGLAFLAVFLADLPWVKVNLRFSPLLIVILLGILVASVHKLSGKLDEGIKLAQKPILRWAVAGLGFKLSLPELLKIGGPSLVVVLLATVATLAFGWWVARAMGVGEKMSVLLGVGTSICGASAIVAADSVVQAESEESAVSLGVITLWGTVGIFVLPLLGQALSMTQFAYGVWAGASLQEMAQVVAGGAAMGDEASKVATVVKLARICLLAPVVFYLVWWMKSKHKSVGEAKVSPVPWFLVVFVVFAALNSLGPSVGLTKPVVDWLVKVDTLALSIGMAGVGLKTSVKDLKSAGWKPVVAGLAAWVFITLFSIATIKLAGI